MSSSGTESDSSAASDVDFDDSMESLVTRIYGRRTQINGRGSEWPTSRNREQPTSE